MPRTATSLSEAIDAARQGRKVQMQCPAHEDDNPSLSVNPGTEQPVVLTCHANCTTQDILDAAGLSWADISKEMERDTEDYWTPNGQASDIYPYHLPDGTLSYEVLRVPTEGGKKRFFQRRPDPTSQRGRAWNLEGVTRVPYRLPEVIKAVQAGMTIHIAEGEKCVHALLKVIGEGEEATTNSGGAEKWRDEYGHWFSGANVIIYADSDDTGRVHARDVRQNLIDHGCIVTIKEAPPAVMPGGGTVHDVADHIAAGFGLDALLETTPDSAVQRARTAVDWLDITKRDEHKFEFVIPGVLARGERLLLVGYEGHGKSLFCRQIAACLASGIHPFTLRPIEPRRVLYIDAENHPGQVLGDWKRLAHICTEHGNPQPGYLNVLEEWDSTIDLATRPGKLWLKERVNAYRPELIVLGPLKNLVQDNLSSHETVNGLRNTINQVRAINEAAVIMEHHAPLRMTGDRVRELRPYGSGLFLGWPDFGYALAPSEVEGRYDWKPFRGDRVRGRHWPDGFKWGRRGSLDLPWEPTYDSL